MSTSTRVTLAEYHERIGRGEFVPREEHHVELIRGEVLPMSPIGPPHSHVVDLLNDWSWEVLPRGAVWVRVQGSVAIPALESEPEPDLVWLRRGDFSRQHPEPADVLLLVEVSDSSLAKDRGLKAELYAEAGVADYWVVDVPGRRVEVRRGPEGRSYRSVEAFGPGAVVRPMAFPEAALDVRRIFPDEG